MQLSVDGIVLKSTEYGKNSRVLTVLSAQKGKISVIARGCVSLKSSIHAASNIFAYSQMQLFQNGGRYYLDSADIKELFFNLHSDIEKYSLSQYLLEICTYVSQEESDETELMRLLLNTLFRLCSSQDIALIKAVFEIKLCQILGFMPDIECCSACGKAGGGFIHLDDAYLVCADCISDKSGFVFVNDYAAAAMRRVFSLPVNRIFSFELIGESLVQFTDFSERYFEAQTGIKAKSLEFYKGLQRKDT